MLLASLALLTGCGQAPVAVVVPAPDATTRAACARLGMHLPTRLEGKEVRRTTPRSPLVFAWGDPPLVLRCGVERPAGYDPKGSVSATVNGVDWVQDVAGDVVRWTAVGRAAYVELAVPTSYDEHGPFLVELADPIKKALPAVPGR